MKQPVHGRASNTKEQSSHFQMNYDSCNKTRYLCRHDAEAPLLLGRPDWIQTKLKNLKIYWRENLELSNIGGLITRGTNFKKLPLPSGCFPGKFTKFVGVLLIRIPSSTTWFWISPCLEQDSWFLGFLKLGIKLMSLEFPESICYQLNVMGK